MVKKMQLTKRRTAWVESRKPALIKGKGLKPSASLSIRYDAKLQKQIARMTEETEKAIAQLFKSETATEYFAEDASIASQARILMNSLSNKFDEIFGWVAKPYSESFIGDVTANASATLHESLRELSGGLSLNTTVLNDDTREIVTASIAENVQIIKTIPQQYLTGVQGAVMRSITTGNGMADLVPFLKKHKQITERRARFIALDQTRKSYGSISRAKMQAVGVKQFEWVHSSASVEPRRKHLELSGGIYNFDEPPIIDPVTGERGFPAQLINCKCFAKPIISFQEYD